MAGPNIFRPDFDDDSEAHGFFRRWARLGPALGAQALGAGIIELPPGTTPSPYHLHHANEEMFIVLEGRPTLRTPVGTRELEEGEVVSFLAGDEGAHQVSNWTDEPARLLMISTMVQPDIVVYPDSGKTGVRSTAPGRGGGLRENHLAENAVDYWEGESPPDRPGS